MVELIGNLDLYKIPSEEIRQNRKIFYSLHREDDEQITPWLDRVQSSSNRCGFAKFANFLIVDRFICGLKHSELNFLDSSNSWSLKRLKNLLTNQDIQTEFMNTNEQIYGKIDHDASIAVVKCETVSHYLSENYTIFLHSYPICLNIRMTVTLQLRRIHT